MGHEPARPSQGVNAERHQKRLSAVLMAEDKIVVIDDGERPVQGDFPCSMLTQKRVHAHSR